MRLPTRHASRQPKSGLILDLHDYIILCQPKRGRPVKHPLTGWRVHDNWPERVPITAAELDVFDAWFGDILDELFEADATEREARGATCCDGEQT